MVLAMVICVDVDGTEAYTHNRIYAAISAVLESAKNAFF